MDDQHGILIDTLSELRLALLRGAGRDLVSTELNRLFQFTSMHFSSEEQLMERHAFPGLALHRAEHLRLIRQIRDSTQHVQRNEDTQVRPLLDFLRNWYQQHFEGLDREYGPWLNDRGIF
jgi:hemerythrin-like metal-binding protein